MTDQAQQPAEGQAAPPPPQGEPMTLTQLKQGVCRKLTQIFGSKVMNERLLRMAGGDMSRVAKNLTAFLSVISQDDGSGKPKKYYYQCSINSLVMCFLESMNMQLPFDSRKLVSMIIYDWEAELDISYKGFINALGKHYDDAFVDAKLVFEDDIFECEEVGGKASYRHKPANPFATVKPNFGNIVGAYCYFSYRQKGGHETVSRIVRMSKEDILMIKSKARTTNVWNEFQSEMGIKAVIRRGSKIPFAAIDLDIDIEEADNKHYLLDKPESGQRLELLMKAQEEVVHGEKANQKAEEKGANANNDDTVKAADSSNAPGVSGSAGGAGKGQDEAGDGKIAGSHEDTAKPGAESDEERAERQSIEADSVQQSSAPAVAAPAAEVLPPPAAGAWDGKTVYMGEGKSVARDFPTPAAALIYVKKVLSQRNHKASRQDILKGNQTLIDAVLVDNGAALVGEIKKLAEQGA